MLRAGCDNTMAGVLITAEDGRYLMLSHATWPDGIAPPAAHVRDYDRQGSYPGAVRALVAAQLRVSVRSLEQAAAGGWRDDRCCRPPGAHGRGHDWQVYTATVTGTAKPPRRRSHRPQWLGAGELQQLALRTAGYARGQLTDTQFFARPGIQPVWVAFLAGLGIITMPQEDLAAIDSIARTGGSS